MRIGHSLSPKSRGAHHSPGLDLFSKFLINIISGVFFFLNKFGMEFSLLERRLNNTLSPAGHTGSCLAEHNGRVVS